MTDTTIVKGKGVRLSTSPGPVPPRSSWPMVELMVALEDHAGSLGANPAIFPRPIGMPAHMEVPATFIVAGRWQPRSVFIDADLGDLRESIAENGIINPLLVFANEHGKFELIAGERRLRAAGLAELSMVPVEIVEGSPARLHEISIIDNLQRENLRPWEEGAAFERMIAELGISEAELCRRMGKNRAYVQQRRALAGAAPELQQALADESISFGVARGIIAGASGDHEVQRGALEAVRATLKSGKPVKEDGARKVATDLVVELSKQTLHALGWTTETHYGSGALVVWAPSERPRVMSENALIDMAASGARPATGDGPTPWEADEDFTTVFYQRGYMITSNTATIWGPWVCLYLSKENGGPVIQWFAGDEIPEQARQVQAELDAFEEQVTGAGWAIRRRTGSTFFVKDDKRSESAYTWSTIMTLWENISAGTAALADRPKCPQCDDWLDNGPTMYYGGTGRASQIHQACKEKAIEAERQSILAQSPGPADQPSSIGCSDIDVPSWVEHIPEPALRALIAFMTDADEARSSSLAELREEFAVWIETAMTSYPDAA